MNSPIDAAPLGPASTLAGAHSTSLTTSWELLPRKPKRTARDLAIRFFYRKKLFACCLALGLLAGGIEVVLSRTIFTADTVLIVLLGSDSMAVQDPLRLDNTPISIDGLKAVQSEIQIILAEDVIRSTVIEVGPATLYPALNRPRFFGLLPPLDQKEQIDAAAQRFRDNLRAEAQGSSNAIRVSFSHPSRELAVNALRVETNTYLEQRRKIYATNNATALGQEIVRYNARLAQIDADIQAVRKKYDVLDMAQDTVLATNRLDGIVQRQNQVRERQVAVETEVSAVQANLLSQPPTVLDFRETTNSSGNDEARNTLVRLTQEREHLVTQYQKTWPALPELDKKIAAVRAEILAGKNGLYFTERSIRNPAIGVLNNRLASLEIESHALSQQLVELDAQSKSANERIQSLREADGPLHGLQLNRDIVEGIYRQLSLRQPSAVLSQEASLDRSDVVRVAQPPSAPLQGRNLALSYAIGGVFFGVLLGFTAVVIATILQQNYILPSDAEQDLKLPSLGDIVPVGTLSALPQGYGVVASNLQGLAIEGRPLSMIQIVSLTTDNSVGDVVYALGAEFARVFAMRTLIIDLPGTIEVRLKSSRNIMSAAAFAIPVRGTDSKNLWISVDAQRSLFGEADQTQLGGLRPLEELRKQFDIVLVIAPTDLSEPMVTRLARAVDASIFILHAERTRSAVADRAREMIIAAGGNLAGFIFFGRKLYVPRWLYQKL
jgi:predicted  nucleic acid-binding Zn-ribbon protein